MKSGSAVAEDAFRSLRLWQKYANGTTSHVGLVYGGDVDFTRSGVTVLSWRNL